MPGGRPKVKTDMIQIRVAPRIKAAAERAAEVERRSLTNWLEVLILDRCKQLNIDPEAPSSKESHT